MWMSPPGPSTAAGRWMPGAWESGNLIQKIPAPREERGREDGAAQQHPGTDSREEAPREVSSKWGVGGRAIPVNPKAAILLPAGLPASHI